MKILVTGAAGYIGSVVCWRLLDAGREVVAVDDLRYGVRSAVPPAASFAEAGIAHIPDEAWDGVSAVAHLAAESDIPKSFAQPAACYQVNVTDSIQLVKDALDHGVRRIVYAGTSSVYHPAQPMPLTEHSRIGPISPYGTSKLAFEQCLPWFPWDRWVAFRFFNVCGATAQAWERPYHRSRIIPVAMDAARCGIGVTINGDDYETPDGTCVRDFVHVDDIAAAFLAAVVPGPSGILNLGVGRGYSIKDVIDAVQRVTGKTIPVTVRQRRPGDPPTLLSDPSAAKMLLRWQPKYTTIEEMIESAWKWER